MPKNNVTDLITDQEMAFARLALSGTITDRDAAEAVGLNPDAAAYTKSKPRVRAYMLQHRAAMQQQILQQEADRLRRQEQRREQVLDRLWEIANLSSEMTRGSITGQVKAIQMIVAIEGLIPDARAGSAKKNSIPHPSPDPVVPEPNTARTPEADLPPHPVPSGPIVAGESIPSEVPHPFLPPSSYLPDTRVPFSIEKNGSAHHR